MRTSTDWPIRRDRLRRRHADGAAGRPTVRVHQLESAHERTHRTIAASWLRETTTENFVWMSPSDAAERGLKNGDVVEVVGPEGTLSGHVRVTEGIRPGVVGANYSFGQQATPRARSPSTAC